MIAKAIGTVSSSGAKLRGNGYVGVRVLFTVCLNFVLFENSLALVEDVMHPVRCSTVCWVSTASLGCSFMPRVGAGVGWKKKKRIKGRS